MPIVWGAKLEGHVFDLQDWREIFAAPFDPRVDLVPHAAGEMSVLHSSAFDNVAGGEEAMARAIPVIEQMNGAALLSRSCRPVSFGAAVSIDGDRVSVHHFVQLQGLEARLRGSALGLAIGPEGQSIPPPKPVSSDAQNWIGIAANNDDVGDLLSHVSKATNWYDLYKAIELVERIAGGAHEMEGRLGDRYANWRLAKRTANFYRHARADRPPNPMDLPGARELVISVTREVLR
jgi:hypothetical protein